MLVTYIKTVGLPFRALFHIRCIYKTFLHLFFIVEVGKKFLRDFQQVDWKRFIDGISLELFRGGGVKPIVLIGWSFRLQHIDKDRDETGVELIF